MASFQIREASVPVSIVFDATIFPFLGEADRDLLQTIFSGCKSIPAVSQFSLEFRRCLYAICGPDSANLLQVDPATCTRKCLDLDHLNERPVNFYLRHISDMPTWTNGRQTKASTGDHIVIERVIGPPYLQGDHRSSNPKGALDFAVSAILRDSVWIDSCLAFVSPEYVWHKLYLADAGAYRHCLDNATLFDMGEDKRTYAESCTRYRATASAPFRALIEIGARDCRSIALVGPKSVLTRPGMGVVVEAPLTERVQGSSLDTIYGTVMEIDTNSSNLQIRLLLGRENLPEYVLAKMAHNELIQTNATLMVPFSWVSGTFRLWPPQLFQADCIPMDASDCRGKFLSRIVVCDLEFTMAGEKSDRGDIAVSLDIFPKLLQGQLPLTLSRLKPFPVQAALAYIFHMHELDGGLNPPASAYRCLLGQALKAFARQKAMHAKSNKDQLSFRPDMPGNALMVLLYLSVVAEDRVVAISNGNLLVEVPNLEALRQVFGFTPSRIDLRADGFGIVDFHGPFVFKWSMYDTLEPWGPLSGSVSISVGAFTEYNRMGTEVIKSSKCHPDALRGSRIDAPLEKKARKGTARRDTQAVTGKTRPHPSKAPAQAMARMERRVRRWALSGGPGGSPSQSEFPRLSTSESSDSTEEPAAMRSCSQAPNCSDSQTPAAEEEPGASSTVSLPDA